jgi:hypothetical protein
MLLMLLLVSRMLWLLLLVATLQQFTQTHDEASMHACVCRHTWLAA